MYRRYRFHELSKSEMMKFVTALLLLGLTGAKIYSKAWNSRNAQSLLHLNELMTRNRFESIAAFFHVVTPEEECFLVSHPLKKVLPLHLQMKQKCSEFYQPLQQLSVDEHMVKSKARTRFRQYMKNKPTKWGVKNFVISDPTGYTSDFNLYGGATQTERAEQGLAYDAVINLATQFQQQNYKIYCNNFWGAKGAPILFSLLGIRMASCSYWTMYVCMYLSGNSRWRRSRCMLCQTRNHLCSHFANYISNEIRT